MRNCLKALALVTVLALAGCNKEAAQPEVTIKEAVVEVLTQQGKEAATLYIDGLAKDGKISVPTADLLKAAAAKGVEEVKKTTAADL